MTARELIAETVDLSRQFADTYERLSDAERAGIERQIVALGAPYADADGLLVLPGRSLVAAATA